MSALRAIAVLGSALILLAATDAAAQGARRETTELGEKEKALQQQQRQLREERAKAADARKREAGLLAELEQMDKRLGAKRAQLAALDSRIRGAQGELGSLQVEIRRLEVQRAAQQEGLGRRLRAMYKLEAQGGGVLPVLLSREDPVERAVRFRHLATLATVDARTIKEYRVTTVALAERQGRVEARRVEMGGLRGAVQEEQAAMDAEASRRRVLLAKVRDERGYHDRMVVELSEATRRLEAFIRDLQTRQRRVVAKAPTPERPGPVDPGAGMGALRGRLTWPVSGRVIGEFGPQVHPRFGTKTFRNGIDIEVSQGTAIMAPYPGHVVYSGWFRGYGNLVILDHGNEYYTLYGHAAEIRVNEGEDVKQGQLIATVGDSGSLGGPHLYFEVRHQGKPQDPVQWLRPRG